VKGASRVVIATEDQRIVDFAKTFGGEAVLTPESCANGTERVWAAIEAAGLTEENIINFQGDAVLTPPWILEAMVEEFKSDKPFDVVTPVVKLSKEALEEFVEHKKKPENAASG